MTFWVLLGVIAVLLAINVFLWKSGFVHEAESPPVIEDKPVRNAKERKVFLKRLNRWREDGRLTREEFEKLQSLSQTEWDEEEEI